MRLSNNLGSNILSNTSWKDQTCLKYHKIITTGAFLIIFGVIDILSSFRSVLEEKAGKKLPESLRFELTQKRFHNFL